MDDPPPRAKRRRTTTTAAVSAEEDEKEPDFLDKERRGEDPPPTAKRQKTTAAADEKQPTCIRAEDRGEAAAKDDRTVVDLLRSLPANIGANYIYPFAVKVIQNHEDLIVAVDEYLGEFYSDDDGEEEKNDDEDVVITRIRHPIGDWDVSRVDDFTSVFDHMRNRKARYFNEDLSR
jgi:hypothetical protein